MHVVKHVLGVTIVTPIRNDHGHFQNPHANVLGRYHSGYGPPRRCGPPRIDYASEYGPTSADTVRHSRYDSTIENTTLSHEMTVHR